MPENNFTPAAGKFNLGLVFDCPIVSNFEFNVKNVSVFLR
jgi:hypothetical protein